MPRQRVVVVVALVGLVLAGAVAFVVLRDRATPAQQETHHGASRDATDGPSSPHGGSAESWSIDPVIDDFRAVERASLARYNGALARQRANEIDENELANDIERSVLGDWKALRQRVTAATVPGARASLYSTLARYLEARQISWEAYVAALRAPTDEAAAPHLQMHRQKNADADREARALGEMFRALRR